VKKLHPIKGASREGNCKKSCRTTRRMLDPERFRKPSGPTVPELIRPGDVIEHRFSHAGKKIITGPYEVIEVSGAYFDPPYVESLDYSLDEMPLAPFPHYSLSLSQGGRGGYYVNHLVGVDERILANEKVLDDEIVFIKRVCDQPGFQMELFNMAPPPTGEGINQTGGAQS
jgi:hypothetical protein